MRDAARPVVCELAANAIGLTGTEFDVFAGYTGRYLRIAVSDASTTMPRLPGGPPANAIIPPGSGGLHIVAAAGSNWGVTRRRGGKTVWVLMKAYQG